MGRGLDTCLKLACTYLYPLDTSRKGAVGPFAFLVERMSRSCSRWTARTLEFSQKRQRHARYRTGTPVMLVRVQVRESEMPCCQEVSRDIRGPIKGLMSSKKFEISLEIPFVNNVISV